MTPALDTSPLGTLPALRSLGKLADLRPVLVIDTREQDPLAFTRLDSVRAGLQSGDYSFLGGEHLFAVERKSIDDLVGCCVGDNRERFERELHRLRGFRFKRLLIIGHRWMIEGRRYKSRVEPSVILHSLAAWEARYDIPVEFCEQPAYAAQLVESWAWWFAREMVETANVLLRGTQAGEKPHEAALPNLSDGLQRKT
jgi:DNA excision repair protein ERCC-4